MDAAQIIIIICGIVSCLACATRFYLRVIVKKRVEFLEFSLVFALVMQLIFIGLELSLAELLPKVHDPSSYIEVEKLFFAGTFFYLAALWAVKIAINFLHIQLTMGFQRIRFAAVCNLYFLVVILPAMYIMYLVACWPVERRWASPTGHQCKPLKDSWDFWTFFSIHISTDITLCILPFPALLKVTETRLRIAICMVYSMAFIAIIATTVRIILLVTDPQNSIRRIMVFTTIEVTVSLVVGIIPGISSSFTRKYAQGHTYPFSSRSKKRAQAKPSFVHLSGLDTSAAKDKNDVITVELEEIEHHAVGFAEHGGFRSSPAGSTDRIIGPAGGRITKTTDFTVARENR